MTATGIFAVIIVFAGLIFIHELGHFLVARFFGIGVQTFSIGFGKKIVQKHFGKTNYCLSIIPLGGYVSLVGEEEQIELPEGFTPEESFALRPAWQRLCVVVAGASFNLLLACVLYFCVFFFAGKPYILPVIGEVSPNSPAYMAEIQAGDTISRINNIPITRWEQVREITQLSAGSSMEITIMRNNTDILCTLTPIHSTVKDVFGDSKKAWILGLTPKNIQGIEHLGFLSAVYEGFSTAYTTLELTAIGLLKLVQGSVSADNVGGPIMIAQVINSSSEYGIVAIVMLAALISVNLGFINLLPIPVLDGGHIVFLVLEMVLRRPVAMEWRIRLTNVGIALLLSLMIFATYNDVMRFFK